MSAIPAKQATRIYRLYQRPSAVTATAGHSTSQYRHLLTAVQDTTVGRYLLSWHRAFTWPQRLGILLMLLGGLLRGWWALKAGV